MVYQQIIINDLRLGRCQKAVCQYLLFRQGLKHQRQIKLLSEQHLMIPAHWAVKPPIALTLAAKLWIFQQSPTSGKTLYLDGNLLCQGDVSELFQFAEEGIVAPANLSLGHWDIFIIDHASPLVTKVAEKITALVREDYSVLAELNQLNHNYLRQDWLPVSYGQRLMANLLDCRALHERPWYNAFAPVTQQWLTYLQKAIANENLSWDDIEQDIEQGWVRPSLLWQLQQPMDVQINLPPDLIEDDQRFIAPELRVSAEQQQLIASTIFPLPRREWHRLLLSPKFLFKFELPHQMSRIWGFLKKFLSRLF